MSRINLVELIQAKGLKPTAPRLKILTLLVNLRQPLSAEEVAGHIGSAAHLATIYRNLEKLVSVGLLERLDFQEGKFRYEFVKEHHHHAVCEGCGLIEEVNETHSEIAAIEKRITKQSGFVVNKHAFELFGFCKKCIQKGALHV